MFNRITPASSFARLSCALVTLAIGLASGCQSYEPKPLDPDATRQMLAQRSAASPEVAAFAEHLAKLDTQAVPGTFNPDDGLSLPEAEVVALVFNPQLRLARLQAGVAKATADTAGIWEDPVTGFNLNDVLTHNGSVTMGAQFSLTIPISGRLDAEKERAGAAYAAELAEVQSAEWLVRVELRRAWAVWTSSSERIRVLQETSEALEPLIGIVDRMERADEMPRVEARLFRIEHASLRAEIARLRNKVQEDRIAINRLMGLAAWNDATLTPASPPDTQSDQLESLRDTMMQRSPVIAALRAQYDVAEKALATEIRKQYPDIELGPTYNTDGNEDFTFGVQFPLPLWNHNQQGVAQAFAQREVSRAQFETAVELQLSDLQSAVVARDSAATQRQLMEAEIVPLVDKQLSETQRIAQLGEVNTLIQLDTLTRRQNAKLALIEARQAEWLALIQLAHVVGPPPRVLAVEPTTAPAAPPAEQSAEQPAAPTQKDAS